MFTPPGPSGMAKCLCVDMISENSWTMDYQLDSGWINKCGSFTDFEIGYFSPGEEFNYTQMSLTLGFHKKRIYKSYKPQTCVADTVVSAKAQVPTMPTMPSIWLKCTSKHEKIGKFRVERTIYMETLPAAPSYPVPHSISVPSREEYDTFHVNVEYEFRLVDPLTPVTPAATSRQPSPGSEPTKC